MKKHLIFLFCLFIAFSAMAQDKIYLNDNSVVSCKVTEITLTDVKYKKSDNLNGPDYILPKTEIALIIYENGTHEVINAKPSAAGKQESGDVAVVDILPSYQMGKNLISINYFDLVFKNVSVGYTRYFCDYRFAAGINASVGFTKDYNNYSGGNSFLGFAKDYFHTVAAFNYLPVGMRKVTYFTGLSFMAGYGAEYAYDNYWEPAVMHKKTYYGFYVNNGVQFNVSKKFNIRTALALGLVDRNMNGDFQSHALFEIAAGIRF